MMKNLFVSCGLLAAVSVLAACPEDTPSPAPDASSGDAPASETVDDVGSGSCTAVTLGSWSAESSDVSAALVASVNESVLGKSFEFRLLFERYGPIGGDMGTFDFSQAPDNNFGTCAHCAVASSNDAEPTFFYVDQGSLQLNQDPYGRVFDLSVTGLRLIEVTLDPITRSSTPVPGGACITVDDFAVDQAFPVPDWTCDQALFGDGQCHCDCAGFDPDCQGTFGQPPPEPVDCEANEACAFDPVLEISLCRATCDWKGRTACAQGICVPSVADIDAGDQCLTQAPRFDLVAVGEPCQANNYQRYCAVDDPIGGFAMGYCDAGNVCRAFCESDAECTDAPDHSCQFFLIGQPSYGYCGPPPPADG